MSDPSWGRVRQAIFADRGSAYNTTQTVEQAVAAMAALGYTNVELAPGTSGTDWACAYGMAGVSDFCEPIPLDTLITITGCGDRQEKPVPRGVGTPVRCESVCYVPDCPDPPANLITPPEFWDGDDTTWAGVSGSLNLNPPTGWCYQDAVTVDTFTLKQALDPYYVTPDAPDQKWASSGWVLRCTSTLNTFGNPVDWVDVYTRPHATWQKLQTVHFPATTAKYWRVQSTDAAWHDAGGGSDAANGWVIHTLELCGPG